jgi:hypothetical protein
LIEDLTMAEHKNYFTPEYVDEQIEQITRLSHLYDVDVPTEARLIHDLHIAYEKDTNADVHSLNRAWTRLAATRQQEPIALQSETIELVATPPSNHHQNNLSIKRTWSQRLNILVAAALIMLLLGSSIVVFAHASLNKNSSASIASSDNRSLAPATQPTMPPPTPTPPTHAQSTIQTFNPTATPTPTPTPFIPPTPMYCTTVSPSSLNVTLVKGTVYAPQILNTTFCGKGRVTVTSSPGITVSPKALSYTTFGAYVPVTVSFPSTIVSGTYSVTFTDVNGGFRPVVVPVKVTVLPTPTPTPSLTVTPSVVASVVASPTVSVTPVVTAVATAPQCPTIALTGKCG